MWGGANIEDKIQAQFEMNLNQQRLLFIAKSVVVFQCCVVLMEIYELSLNWPQTTNE